LYSQTLTVAELFLRGTVKEPKSREALMVFSGTLFCLNQSELARSFLEKRPKQCSLNPIICPKRLKIKLRKVRLLILGSK